MQRPLSQHLCHNLVTYQHSSSDFERKNELGIGKSWQHSTFVINCMNFVLRIMVLLYNHLKLLKYKKYGKNYVQMYVLQELLLLMLGPAISTMVCVAFFFFFFSQSAFFWPWDLNKKQEYHCVLEMEKIVQFYFFKRTNYLLALIS